MRASPLILLAPCLAGCSHPEYVDRGPPLHPFMERPTAEQREQALEQVEKLRLQAPPGSSIGGVPVGPIMKEPEREAE